MVTQAVDTAKNIKEETPMKKTISLFLALVMVLSCVSFAAAEDVVIKWASPMLLETPEGPWIEKAIEEFNALDNGYTVEGLAIPTNDLDKKIIAAAGASDLPDLVTGYNTTLTNLVDMELARPMSEFFSEEYIADFIPFARDSSSIDGVLYAHPFFVLSQGIVYRKDLFDAKNIAAPTTWDELVAACKALTEGESYGMAYVGTRNGSGGARFSNIIRNFGVDEFYKDADGKWQTDIGSEKYIAALKAVTELDTVHKVVPPGVIETGYPEAVALLSSGKAAMLVTGSNAVGAITAKVPELVGKLGSCAIPNVGRQVNCSAGSALFVLTPADQGKDEGIKLFLEFLTGKEKALELTTISGRLPVFTSQFNDPSIQAIPGMDGFLDAMINQEAYIAPSIPGYNEINDIGGEAYQSVFMGEKTVEEAAAIAQERAQELCDDANEGY